MSYTPGGGGGGGDSGANVFGSIYMDGNGIGTLTCTQLAFTKFVKGFNPVEALGGSNGPSVGTRPEATLGQIITGSGDHVYHIAFNASFNGDIDTRESQTTGFNATWSVFHKGVQLARPILASGFSDGVNLSFGSVAASGLCTLSQSTTLDLRILGGSGADKKCNVGIARLSITKVSS